jgi:hypothetical protein
LVAILAFPVFAEIGTGNFSPWEGICLDTTLSSGATALEAFLAGIIVGAEIWRLWMLFTQHFAKVIRQRFRPFFNRNLGERASKGLDPFIGKLEWLTSSISDLNRWPRLRNFPKRYIYNWKSEKISIWTVATITLAIAWVASVALVQDRRRMQILAGAKYQESKMGYGQFLAALIWLPVLVEYLYVFTRKLNTVPQYCPRG